MTEVVGDYEYQKKDLIGHGAFAVVFKGKHRKKNETVAIKVINTKNFSHSKGLPEKEIKILKELNHENVVSLFYFKESSSSMYLVMEYCNGGDLADYLHAKRSLSEDTIRIFVRQLASAMAVLHSKGIIHRDLKPQNILLSHSGKNKNPPPSGIKLKIGDFGFARTLQGDTMAATLCGSPMYMAPEVLMSQSYDGKADLWSIGTILYQCLVGKAPFLASSPQELKNFYVKTKKLEPVISDSTSRELKSLLLGLLKKDCKERMSFDEFFTHSFLAGGSKVKQSSPVAVPVPVRSRNSDTSGSSEGRNVSISPPVGVTPKSPPAPQLASTPTQPRNIVVRGGGHVSPPEVEGYRMGTPSSLSSMGGEEEEDFVMVPSDLPSAEPENAAAIIGYQKDTETVELNPSTRPSTLPVQTPMGRRSRSDSEPIPVPSPLNPFSLKHSPQATSTLSPLQAKLPALSQPQAIPQPAIARKPLSGGKAVKRLQQSPTSSSSPHSITPPLGSTATAYAPSRNSPLLHSPSSLPTIYGSPTKKSPELEDLFPDTGLTLHKISPTQPLNMPFAGSHAAKGSRPHRMSLPSGTGGALAARPGTSLGSASGAGFHRSASSGRLSDDTSNLRKTVLEFKRTPSNSSMDGLAGLAPSHTPPGVLLATTPPREVMTLATSNTRSRKGSIVERLTPPGHAFATSPPNMEGPIAFVAPPLPEETLLEPEHNETLDRLIFCLQFVEAIMDVAQSRASSPIADSLLVQQSQTLTPGHGSPSSIHDSQRLNEQMMLYLKALHLLANALHLARSEIRASRLQLSFAVKTVIQGLNHAYSQCLGECRILRGQSSGVQQVTGETMETSAVSADKLLYEQAINMCQQAALDELFGTKTECIAKYQCAKVILDGLCASSSNQEDQYLLLKYKSSLDRRIEYLKTRPYQLTAAPQ